MAFVFSSKILLIALSWFVTQNRDITFLEAKNQILRQYIQHNADQDFGAKTTKFEITDNGFIRYKKIDYSNKTEYYSVKLTQFTEMNYLGNEDAGWLVLKFKDEAVIYQTYNDKDGNVDEMLNEIKIPLKDIKLSDIGNLEQSMDVLRRTSFP